MLDHQPPRTIQLLRHQVFQPAPSRGGDWVLGKRLRTTNQDPKNKEVAMLILSRKLGERIYIGRDVVVTIARVAEGKVWLGIDAPLEVPVHREEVRAAIQDEEAAGGDDE